jgi:hypothetical protein
MEGVYLEGFPRFCMLEIVFEIMQNNMWKLTSKG